MYRADYEQTAADLKLIRGVDVVRSEKEIPVGFVRVSDLPDPQRFYKMIDRGLMLFYDVRRNLEQQKSGALFVWAPDVVRLAVYWTQKKCEAEVAAKDSVRLPQQQEITTHPRHNPIFEIVEVSAIDMIDAKIDCLLAATKKPLWKKLFQVAAR